MSISSNTFKTILGFIYSRKRAITKNWKSKYSQSFLLILTGFFITQFFLLNILYSQHPLGGWQTALGNITTQTLLSVVLFALLFCLVALWRSATTNKAATTNKKMTKNYSIPTTFINVSPE